MRSERAPAKINLYLHVGPARADGRHDISSLAVFADVGDTVSAALAGTPSLDVGGRFADQVGPNPDNLITRVLALAGAAPMAVRLDKQLPVASGLGGGTADAGAALRLALGLDAGLTPARIEEAARKLGADGLLCLRAKAAIAEGEGERLCPAPRLPELHAVLVNPGVPSSTAAVYRAYDEGPGAFSAQRPGLPAQIDSLDALLEILRATRNDLEGPAMRLEPRIGDARAVVSATEGVLFARMSGSGATIFGLCADASDAAAAADAIRAMTQDWWVVPTRLN